MLRRTATRKARSAGVGEAEGDTGDDVEGDVLGNAGHRHPGTRPPPVDALTAGPLDVTTAVGDRGALKRGHQPGALTTMPLAERRQDRICADDRPQ
ncbi:hypothetical protein [Gordonia sp. NPDC003950]